MVGTGWVNIIIQNKEVNAGAIDHSPPWKELNMYRAQPRLRWDDLAFSLDCQNLEGADIVLSGF